MFCSKCGANLPETATFCSACGQPTGVLPPTPAGSVIARPAVQYAGFWLRFVAFIIDIIVLGFVGFFLTLPFAASFGWGMFMRGRAPMSPEEWMPFFSALWRVVLIRLVLNWLYFAFLESSSWQATLGKKALGLEVTDLQGRRISFARASGRFFGKFLSVLILWIGFIMAGFTARKQALHDILAGCLVIRKV